MQGQSIYQQVLNTYLVRDASGALTPLHFWDSTLLEVQFPPYEVSLGAECEKTHTVLQMRYWKHMWFKKQGNYRLRLYLPDHALLL